MKTSFYCVKCRNPIESEILEVQEMGGRRYAKGECKICGTNLSVVIPNKLKVESKPYEEEIESPEIKEIKKKIIENEKKLKEERIKLKEEKDVNNFIKNADENIILKKHNIFYIKRSFYRFLKVIMVLFFIFILIVVGLLVWAGFSGKFASLITPVFNSTTNVAVNNMYDFKPSSTNNYENTIDARDYNNITVNVKICNGTSC